MIDLALINLDCKSTIVLEPGCDRAPFLKELHSAGWHGNSLFGVDIELPDEMGLDCPDITILKSNFLIESSPCMPDLIIGNPPYIRVHRHRKTKLKLNRSLEKAIGGIGDILHAFIWRSLDLLAPGGSLVFITPHFWLQNSSSRYLRQKMASEGTLTHLFDLGEFPHFHGVSGHYIIFRFVKGSKAPCLVFNGSTGGGLSKFDIKSMNISKLTPHATIDHGFIKQRSANWGVHSLVTYSNDRNLILIHGHDSECVVEGRTVLSREIFDSSSKNTDKKKIVFHGHKLRLNQNVESDIYTDEHASRLGAVFSVVAPPVTGRDKVFNLEKNMLPDDELSQLQKNGGIVEVVKAKNLSRLVPKRTTKYLFLNHFDEHELSKYEYLYKHLQSNKETLVARYSYGKTIPYWHWIFPRSIKRIEKSVFRIYGASKTRTTLPRFCLSKQWGLQDTIAIINKPGITDWMKENQWWFLCGWMNTTFVGNWLRSNAVLRGGVIQLDRGTLGDLPIPIPIVPDKEQMQLFARIGLKIENLSRTKCFHTDDLVNNLDELLAPMWHISDK